MTLQKAREIIMITTTIEAVMLHQATSMSIPAGIVAKNSLFE